jgi:multiple sugar transport system substrate-binding protein
MNRTRRPLAVIASLVLVVTACGRDDDDSAEGTEPAAEGSEPASGEGAAEGTIDVWAMGTEGENLGVLAEDFMAENPDIQVNVTAVPWDAAHDKIVNAIAAGEVPDVSMIGTTWMGEFAKLGGLAETPSSIDSSAFFDGAWATTEVDGTSYGVPWYVETRLIYYRTDLAEAGGFNQAPANWDELTQLAEAQVEGGADVGISLQPGGTGAWQTFMPFFWQAGGEIMDDEGNFTLSSDACVEALTYYDSFSESGLAPDAVSDVPVEGQFADGTVGAFISGPWMIGVVGEAGADPETWTVAHQPEQEAATSFVGGSNLAVLEQADNKEAGWAFVEYLSQPEVQVKWFETVADLPSVTAAWDDPTLADDELLAAFGDQLDDAKAPPAIATWEQIAAGIDSQIEQVVQGSASPEDACAAMQQEAESVGTGL